MDVRRIRKAFGMSRVEFQRCLNVCPQTIVRWESGEEPTGLHRAVLRAMDVAADRLKPEEALEKGHQLRLGLGAYLYHGLKQLVP